MLGRPVQVKLNTGLEYRGVLACLDGYLNIALEQTEEYDNGQLKAKYGDAFIRGNNGESFFSFSFCAKYDLSLTFRRFYFKSALHFNTNKEAVVQFRSVMMIKE